MSLIETLKQIDLKKSAVKAFENVDDPRSKPGRDKAVKDAKAAIDSLEVQYRKELYNSVIAIIGVGGNRERKTELKTQLEQSGVVCVSADKLFEDLAVKCRQYMGPSKKQVTVRASTFIIAELSGVMNFYAPNDRLPTMPSKYLNAFTRDDDHLVEILREVAATVGNQVINVGHTQTAVFDEALKLRVAEAPVGMAAIGVTRKELPAFQRDYFKGRPCIVVDLDDPRNVEDLVEIAQNEAMKLMGRSVQDTTLLTEDDDQDTVA